jgi:hypothetical protein
LNDYITFLTEYPNVTMTSFSLSHGWVAGIDANGTLYLWGAWTFNNRLVYDAKPVGNFTSVSCSDFFCCVIHDPNDGTGKGSGVECFGGSEIPSTVTSGLPSGNFSSVTCGASFVCAIYRDTQRTICWGGVNGNGEWEVPSMRVGQLAPKYKYRQHASLATIDCPIGHYSIGKGSITSMCTGVCTAGRHANMSNLQSTSSCASICPAGSYCPAGSTINIPCPAGYFGSSTGLSSSTCTQPCTQGYYCEGGNVNGLETKCPAGRFGSTAGLTNSACSGMYQCMFGYMCVCSF